MKVFLYIEEELVERTEKSSNSGYEVAWLIKDSLRLQTVGEIVFLLTEVLTNFQLFDKKTVNDALKVSSQLIDWTSLDLFLP
jgi:competence CoiA-like predicted nuclease